MVNYKGWGKSRGIQWCSQTTRSAMLLLPLAHPGAMGASEPLLPHFSQRLWLHKVPDLVGDSDSSRQIASSCICTLLPPFWLGADIGRIHSPLCCTCLWLTQGDAELVLPCCSQAVQGTGLIRGQQQPWASFFILN